MAVMTEAPAPTLTYEAYMAEPEVEGRYDIINGVRIFMPGATYRHQRIANNVGRSLYHYEQRSNQGVIVSAPFDVLIRRFPKLQTRQPDVLFASHKRIAEAGGIPEVGPLEAAPELVIEIISDSETQRRLNEKLTDYIHIGVDECWVVRHDGQTVEVLALSRDGISSIAIYTMGQAVTSVVFPGLVVPVEEVFAP